MDYFSIGIGAFLSSQDFNGNSQEEKDTLFPRDGYVQPAHLLGGSTTLKANPGRSLIRFSWSAEIDKLCFFFANKAFRNWQLHPFLPKKKLPTPSDVTATIRAAFSHSTGSIQTMTVNNKLMNAIFFKVMFSSLCLFFIAKG